MDIWAFKVVPSGMPHRGPDISLLYMSLVAVSDNSAGSEWSEPLARGLLGPLGCCGAGAPGYHCNVGQPTLGRSELPVALGSSFARGALAACPSQNRCPGAGRRLEGSDGPSEVESSSAFLFLTGSCGVSQEVRALLPTPF